MSDTIEEPSEEVTHNSIKDNQSSGTPVPELEPVTAALVTDAQAIVTGVKSPLTDVLGVTKAVVGLSSPLKRKLSIDEYEPTVEEHIGGNIDDESSILIDEDEKDLDELSQLEKESELPISDLMALYGFTGGKEGEIISDDEDRIEDSQDSDTNCEELDTDSVNDIDMEQPAIYDKDDWKKEIMIGAEHQAEVPNFKDIEAYTTDDCLDLLLWSPYLADLDKVQDYLSQIYKEDAGDDLPITDSNRDDEEALYHLHKHCYKADEALSNKERHCLYKTMENWTEEECQGFENGLKIYGKQFNLIHNNLIPSRNIREIIQFYYLWKKTERYDIFIQYSRLGTKRYIFNPGQPLDLDRAPYICSKDEELAREEQENSSLMQCT